LRACGPRAGGLWIEASGRPPGDPASSTIHRTSTGRGGIFLLLTWLRSPRWPGRGQASILHPDADAPLLDVALRTGFVLLREDPGREIVFGTVVCCGRRAPPRTAEEFAALEGSLARAVMNFHVEAMGDGTSRLVTQTRVATSDARAERA
jgi:hypothetical protein